MVSRLIQAFMLVNGLITCFHAYLSKYSLFISQMHTAWSLGPGPIFVFYLLHLTPLSLLYFGIPSANNT